MTLKMFCKVSVDFNCLNLQQETTMNFRRNLISSTAAAVLTLALIPVASAQTVL